MAKVNLIIPCCMDMFSPSVAHSVYTVLERLGDEVIYNLDQTCCGRRFYHSGELELAKELANKLILEYDLKYSTVVPTTSCVGYIKNYYKELLENSAEVNMIRNFTQNIFELCYYIVNIKAIEKLDNIFNHRVFYFKSCSARNLYKIDDEPELLLSNTQGLDLLIDNNLNTCCGANSHFAIANPEVSDILCNQIIDCAYQMGAQYITSTDMHCLQHIDAVLNTLDITLETIHIADILLGGE
ncbi:MAG: (Fe-S)-binding protein [Bacteroidales bacterium]|jgi:L-lactate dehydrogenase complex protein LldE|nr:(Fe-S)-binding protein [Bacteroidales bacterium]